MVVLCEPPPPPPPSQPPPAPLPQTHTCVAYGLETPRELELDQLRSPHREGRAYAAERNANALKKKQKVKKRLRRWFTIGQLEMQMWRPVPILRLAFKQKQLEGRKVRGESGVTCPANQSCTPHRVARRTGDAQTWRRDGQTEAKLSERRQSIGGA